MAPLVWTYPADLDLRFWLPTAAENEDNAGIVTELPGDFGRPAAGSTYLLQFTTTRTTQLAIDATFTGVPAEPANFFFLLAHDGLEVIRAEDGAPIKQTLALLPGRYFLSIAASVDGRRTEGPSVDAGFNVRLAFGP